MSRPSRRSRLERERGRSKGASAVRYDCETARLWRRIGRYGRRERVPCREQPLARRHNQLHDAESGRLHGLRRLRAPDTPLDAPGNEAETTPLFAGLLSGRRDLNPGPPVHSAVWRLVDGDGGNWLHDTV